VALKNKNKEAIMAKVLVTKTGMRKTCWKQSIPLFLVLAVSTLLVSNCNSPTGFGKEIDLVPPLLVVEAVELQNGERKEITNAGDKLFIGPGIVFGGGAKLIGKAYDNFNVIKIKVEDKKANKVWTSTAISAQDPDKDYWQEWSISLPGLDRGERNVEITALDQFSNIGAETIKQLALLVDIDPPVVKDPKIERDTVTSATIYAELLPFSSITELDDDSFETIDYFQNESFKIHAAIEHEFMLSTAPDNVTLNFLPYDQTGKLLSDKPLFNPPLNKEAGTLVYNPSWRITANDITTGHPEYLTGKHYFKVIITAKAEAGHSGSNSITNELFNLCWWPEGDKPHVKAKGSSMEGAEETIKCEMGQVFPLQVFDDDMVNEVYYAIVPDTWWRNTFPSPATTDADKLAYCQTNQSTFTYSGTTPLKDKKTGLPIARNVMVPVQVDNSIGKFRLIVIAKDNTGTTASKLFTLDVTGNLDDRCKLVNIVCDTPDGAYKAGTQLKFKLIFDTAMKIDTGRNVSITISGGDKGIGAPVTINNFIPASGTSNVVFTGSWTVPTATPVANPTTNRFVFVPVQIDAVDIRYATPEETYKSKPTYEPSVITDYNLLRQGLKVMNIPPTITQINGVALNNNTVLSIGSNSKSDLRLTFSQPVWPENGTVRVKPYTGWHIPPVLSNDDFAKILNAVSSTEQTVLNTNYIKTTHGLLKNPNGSYTGTPDTATKYVLDFSRALNTTTGTVNSIRTALETANYNWQEVDVTQVKGEGTDIITVSLDPLPDGRQWKVEIVGPAGTSGAFRDEAGNLFAGWAPNTGSNYAFWSAKTAEPVIRVNRVSNNSPSTAPRTNVQYRIDCETPGATIDYGTLAAIISSTVSNATTGYGANPEENSTYNSNNADATTEQLLGITANTTYSLSGTTYLTIGDDDLYTARKDYIAATATRTGTPSLTISNRGAEGAFKTVIVYRNPNPHGGTLYTNRWVKLEATNTRNGAVTISGFPMNYNDMDGDGSKYTYRNPNATNDWIWISWEIVSKFWHVGMVVDRNPGKWTNDPWEAYGGDWYNHNFRKYGNWGLRTYSNAAGTGY
jgi:predicted small secreted protein